MTKPDARAGFQTERGQVSDFVLSITSTVQSSFLPIFIPALRSMTALIPADRKSGIHPGAMQPHMNPAVLRQTVRKPFHAVQLVYVHLVLLYRIARLTIRTLLDGSQVFSPDCQLCFLRRLESSFCSSPVDFYRRGLVLCPANLRQPGETLTQPVSRHKPVCQSLLTLLFQVWPVHAGELQCSAALVLARV